MFFIADPDDAARKETINATAKNLLLRHGFPVKGVKGAEPPKGVQKEKEKPTDKPMGASRSVGPPLPPRTGRSGRPGRKALTKEQRDMIKGGSMITRARQDQL